MVILHEFYELLYVLNNTVDFISIYKKSIYTQSIYKRNWGSLNTRPKNRQKCCSFHLTRCWRKEFSGKSFRRTYTEPPNKIKILSITWRVRAQELDQVPHLQFTLHFYSFLHLWSALSVLWNCHVLSKWTVSKMK